MPIGEQLASGLAPGELHVCMASIAAPMHRLLAPSMIRRMVVISNQGSAEGALCAIQICIISHLRALAPNFAVTHGYETIIRVSLIAASDIIGLPILKKQPTQPPTQTRIP
jgi:hypothetical protein